MIAVTVYSDFGAQENKWSEVKVAQLYLTLCDSNGIIQARIVEWVAFPFSRESNQDLLHCRWILYQQSYERSQSLSLFPLFPHLLAMMWWDRMPWSFFFEWVLSQLFHSPLFTFIKRLFSYSSLSAIRVVSSPYLGLLISLLAFFNPACASSSPAFCVMYSAYKLNKECDSIQPLSTPSPVWKHSCSMSGSNYCFLTCIQIFPEAGQVVWYSHLLKNFPQLIVIHTVKSFGIVNQAEIDSFSGTLLLFWWSSGCWQFDLWFLCLF